MSEQTIPAGHSNDPVADEGRLGELVEDCLREARASGASAAEAGLSMEAGLSVSVRMGEVETVEYNRDKGLAVTVYFGQRKGSASTTDFSAGALRDTVRAACDIARYTAEDECAGLADPERMADVVPDLELFYPWRPSAEQGIEIARDCEAAALAFDPRIANSEGATVTSHDGARVYGNSHGFIGAYRSSRHSLSCSVIGKSGDSMQRDYWYAVARDAADLDSPVSVGERAAQRTTRRLNGRKLATCQVPVLYEADVARGLLSHFLRAVNGHSLYRKSSFLLDQLGKPLFPAHVRIDERPLEKKALGSAPFDNEGVVTRPRDLVRDGVLQGYVLDSYAARRLGMESTGNAGGVHNLYLSHDDLGFEELLARMGTGLLVTEVMGQGVNTVTGDYSRGASGFWVEGGEIRYPVEEITVAGNLRQMYADIQAIGNDVDRRGNVRSGSILIGEMTVAGG